MLLCSPPLVDPCVGPRPLASGALTPPWLGRPTPTMLSLISHTFVGARRLLEARMQAYVRGPKPNFAPLLMDRQSTENTPLLEWTTDLLISAALAKCIGSFGETMHFRIQQLRHPGATLRRGYRVCERRRASSSVCPSMTFVELWFSVWGPAPGGLRSGSGSGVGNSATKSNGWAEVWCRMQPRRPRILYGVGAI